MTCESAKARKKPRAPTQRWRLALAAARLGVWEWDFRNKTLFWSPECAAILGLELPAEPWLALWNLIHPEDVERVHEALERSISDPDGYTDEFRIIRPTGELRWVACRGQTLWDKTGQPLRFLGILQEITERKQAEQRRSHLEAQLRHAQKVDSLGALAGGIAHDFNNILAGIRGCADLILAEVSPSDPVAQRAEEIRAATQRAAELTRQLLASAGKAPFQPVCLDLSQLVQRMQTMLEAVVSPKVALQYELASGLAAVAADVSRMRQVVLNLVVNAFEALRDRCGAITITTRAESVTLETVLTASGERLPAGDYVCLEVRDTGCGMDEPTRQRALEPFFSTKFRNRGLGLATVSSILRKHHGALQFSSAVEEGSRFCVYLPAAGPTLPSDSAEAKKLPTPGALGTVLIVDDEALVRQALEVLFATAGFQVLTARDGPEALRLFAEQQAKIVCVVLDLVMPRMRGDEVYRELRRLQSDVRVILTCGYLESAIRECFEGLPIFGFVQKPESFDGVIARLQKVLTEGA